MEIQKNITYNEIYTSFVLYLVVLFKAIQCYTKKHTCKYKNYS